LYRIVTNVILKKINRRSLVDYRLIYLVGIV